jgi:hypothetical protein
MAETDLYETDILIWSEQQAALLRRRAANALDWDNLAEEIADVGLSQLHAVMSHLRLALLHDLKAEAWPLSRDVEHWRATELIRCRCPRLARRRFRKCSPRSLTNRIYSAPTPDGGAFEAGLCRWMVRPFLAARSALANVKRTSY